MRELIYPRHIAVMDNYSYTNRAQTGSEFSSTTRDLHGYGFSVHGYYNWRAWAIALTVCEPRTTVIEIGANIGTETVGFADIVGCEGRVIAFEPVPSNFASLERSLNIRHCTNVHAYMMALGHIDGVVQFTPPADDHMTGMGHIEIPSKQAEQQSGQAIEVECRTLSSLAGKLGKPAFIFMDIEGGEYDVISGGRDFIIETAPYIMLEANSKWQARFGHSLEDLLQLLASMAYSVFRVERFGLTPITNKGDIGKSADWLAIPVTGKVQHGRISKAIRQCGMLPCIPGINPLSQRLKQSN